MSEVNPAGGSLASGGSSTLDKGLGVLVAVAASEVGMTLTQIAASVNMDKATALRMLRSLEHAAFIARAPDGTYRLGAVAFQLAHLVERDSHISDIIMPVLDKLAHETGEAAAFFVLAGAQRLCLAIRPGKYPVSANTRKGEFLPLDKGSAGRVLSANRNGWDGKRPIEAITAIGERDPELAGVSAPVFDASGGLLGAVSVSGTAQRFTAPDYAAKIGEMLVTECLRLSTSWDQGGSLDSVLRAARARRGRRG